MKKLLAVAALTWVSVGVVALAQRAPQAPAETGAARVAQAPAAATTPAARPAAGAVGQAAPAAALGTAAEHQQLVDRFCVTCHNARTSTPAADPLRLDGVDLTNVARDAATWERVLLKLSVGAMPPQGMPHPEPAALAAFRTYVATNLDRAAAQANNPGSVVVHRLNRVEYANAVRDLLAVEFNATDMLPSDGGDFGFDNIAAALKTSPLLLERYLAAAIKISNEAVGNKDAAPGASTFPISLEHSQNEHLEGLPLGTRGGHLVRYNFPADAEYQLTGRLMWAVIEGLVGVEGADEPREFIITIDGEQVYSAPLGGEQDHAVNAADITRTRPVIEGRLSARVFVTAGPHDVGFTWVDKSGQEQAVWQPARRDSQEVHFVGGWPKLRAVSIDGPYNVKGISNTASRQKLFVCRPTAASEEAACADRIISTLARRAFRRPVTASDTAAPLGFYREARAAGGDFDAGIRAAVARVLASPSFLYRVERDPETAAAGRPHPVTDLELASRLSLFLWNSIPDDTLLTLASTGQLRAPGVLAAQVKRMVADDKADSFVEAFTGQWLTLRNLESKVVPDLLLFPHFDDNLRKGFRRETEMLFGSVLRDNQSVMALLNANYTFLNERLAKHYGIKGVYGERFRRVEIPDPNRRGLLGHGSLLAVTSVATRTSPTIRGKFILTALMGLPAPVPPPVVPALDSSAPLSATRPATTRERVESHRRNPTCASCHRSIDPLGFALENFDATGQWRTMDGASPVDSSGVLQDGTEINGPAALRNWFVARPEVFVNNVTERLLTYALGRGLEPVDKPVIRSIVKKAAANDYRFLSVVQGIVESAPFQMRTPPTPSTEQRIAQVN
jgi:mono/diheme cytochrome c family protein